MRGELPPWLDVASVAQALSALLDGMLVQAAEEGAGYRRADHERRILALIETILAARDAAAPEPIVAGAAASPTSPCAPARGVVSAAPAPAAPRRSSARSIRPSSAGCCPTSTPRSRCGTSRTAGTTGSSAATSR